MKPVGKWVSRLNNLRPELNMSTSVAPLTKKQNWQYIMLPVTVFISSRSVFILCLLLLGCDEQKWSNPQESKEALGKAIVEALNYQHGKETEDDKETLAQRMERLHQLRVTKEEYLSWILPAFPETHFPDNFVWENLDKKCLVGVRKWAQQYRDKDLEFVSINFEKKPASYDGFQLYRGTVLTVTDGNGQQFSLHILGSVIEKSGKCKLLSYQD